MATTPMHRTPQKRPSQQIPLPAPASTAMTVFGGHLRNAGGDTMTTSTGERSMARLTHMRIAGLGPLVLGTLVLAGCGDGNGDPTDPNSNNFGEASATITGAVSLDFTGVASLAVDRSNALYTIVLAPLKNGTPDLTTRIMLQGRGDRPVVGTHQVVDWFAILDSSADPSAAGGAVVLPTGQYVTTSGTLSITAASATRVTGTARFTALLFGVEDPITVDASFVALCNWTGTSAC
jgi:hypothetical protein